MLAACALLAALGPSARGDGGLDADVLKKLKAGTVYLKVKLTDGRVVQGSGFFTDEPGLIVTNAHVLNMLDPDSRKPLQVDVTITDTADKSRTLPAKVVGVDRGSDLGLLKVDDKELPEPVKLGKVDDVKETDVLFVFGFPFGQNLGKEITVSKANVSKVMKGPGGYVTRLQLDGGINPGNSGGPLVDSKGNVIGVAVSAIKGSQIGFAIPASFVGTFLNGRVIASSIEVPIKDKDELKLPITLELVDPLGRLKKVEVEVWAGSPGNARPSSKKEPEPLAGDSPVKRFDMNYAKKPQVTMDVPAPTLGDPKQVYWVRPVITNGTGETVWVAGLPKNPQPPRELKPVTLQYKPPTGGKQTATLVSLGTFKIRDDDGEEHSLSMNFRTAITEQFAEPEAKVFPMRMVYNQFTLGLKLDDKPMQQTNDINKILQDIRFMAANVEMDKDGSVSTAKADLAKVPKETRDALSDMSDQILESLELMSIPLPDRKLEAKETWKARREFQIGPGLIAVEARGDLVYTYRGIQVRSGKEVVLLGIEGDLKSKRGNELNVGGKVSGGAVIDPETGVVIHADATVKADVDFKFARKSAKAMGTLAVSIDRPALPQNPPGK
jgi:hypothetical protein